VSAVRPEPTRDALLLDRRQFLMAALGGAGAVALGACKPSRSGAGGGKGSRPTVRQSYAATGFPSPFASNADFGYNQMILLYDTLLWRDGSGQLLPWLAKSFKESDDHLTYTFELRDGVKWSDGQPLTADDVVFTFGYYAEQETLSPPVIVQPPQGIAKVTASGATTVVITLERPLVTFPEQVAGALPIIPKHVWSSIDDPGAALDLKVLVGSGPYRLESYKDDGGPLLYTARDDYFLGAPFVKRIEMNAIDDAFSALLSGATDVARGFGLRDDILAPFRRDDSIGMVSKQGTFIRGALYWNMGKEGALSDPRFRRACAMAIDRKDLVTRIAAGKGLPGNPGFLSPENPFFAPVPQHEFDVAGANALLDAAGYRPGPGGIRQDPKGSPLSFELRIDNAEAPMTEILVSALRRVGVELRANPVLIGPELFGNKLFGGYDMVVLPFPGPSAGGPNGDPDVLRRIFSSKLPASLTAATNYVNPAFDDLAEKQRATFDEQERRRMVAEMQRLVAEDLPVLPLFYPEAILVYRKQVLDQWYFTPGQYPTSTDNKQLFVTGQKSGTKVRGSA